MEFHILGPVELWQAGQRRVLGSSKERCILAILLWSLATPVTADGLVDRVWGDNPPAKSRGSLYSYIARLRSRLQHADGDMQARLLSGSGTYTLEADPESVDLYRFRRLRAQARAISDSGDDEQAVVLLREADQLWRGEPLAGLTGDWVSRVRATLRDERLASIVDCVTAELRLGRHADVLGEISDLVAEHPLVETLVGHLMVALYRCGRQGEALQAYREARQRLVEELGTDPSPNLHDLHQRILRGDPGLSVGPRTSWTARAAAPDNLPRDIPNFTGRTAEMRGLLEAITTKSARTAVMIEAVDGMAGVGKSTFAIHAAHQLREHFPDAQLYMQLHAHDASRRPLDPASGLEALLRILGVPAESIPRSLEERAALWRSQLARRRALIVLDDAASHEQVGPLLPGAAGCLVMITSRTRLTGLAGIHSISLDVLSGHDSAALFTSIVGADRAADADAVADITRLCGHLPLAIHLVASRLSHRPAWSVADLAQRLMQAGDRIGEIHIGNPEIGRSFELSYQGLSGDQQQMFRQLCLHPGPDFALHAVTAGAGTSLAESERCLSTLLDHHLLEERVRARFRFHDLIRAYARNLAVRDDNGSQRQLTLHRMLDYYLHTADRADRILYPHRDRIDAPVAHPPANPSPFVGQQEAREWLDAELTNLLTGAQYAAEHGLSAHAALLPYVLAQFLQTHGHWEQVITAHVRAIPAWRAVGDSCGAARALTDLVLMLTRTGRYGDALQHAQEALAIFRTHGDQRGEAEVLDRIGLVYWQSSRFRDALTCHENALAIWRTLGDRHGEAEALAHSAMSLWHVGSYDEAMSRFTRALSIYRDLADCQGEAKTLNNIADVQQHLGLYDDALRRYEQAQALAVDLDDRQGEAVVFNNMGNVYQRLGRYSEALVYYRKALTIYRDLGDRRCEADTLNSIGTAFRHTHSYSEAIVHHQKALAVAHELAEPYQEARSLCSIGDLHLQRRHYDLALDDYRAALELSRRMGDPYQDGLALSGIASTQYHLEDSALAFGPWREALALFEKIGVPEADDVRSRLLAAGSASP